MAVVLGLGPRKPVRRLFTRPLRSRRQRQRQRVLPFRSRQGLSEARLWCLCYFYLGNPCFNPFAFIHQHLSSSFRSLFFCLSFHAQGAPGHYQHIHGGTDAFIGRSIGGGVGSISMALSLSSAIIGAGTVWPNENNTIAAKHQISEQRWGGCCPSSRRHPRLEKRVASQSSASVMCT